MDSKVKFLTFPLRFTYVKLILKAMVGDMSLEDYIIMQMQKIMQRKTVSCYTLARNMGISRSTVRFYLDGSRRLPVFFIEDFCNFMDVTVEELCQGYNQHK